MSDELKIGSVLWKWDVYRRMWIDLDIVGQTSRSWLVKKGRIEEKVSKTDLTAATNDPSRTMARRQFFTSDDKRSKEAEWAWRKLHERQTKDAVQEASLIMLQKVYALLIAEGVLKEEPDHAE